jgi:hypothetical protein
LLPLIAVPVVHSAGGWIASSAAAGTGIAGYVTGITGAGASALGFAPATFLGLTPVGWAITGGAVLTASSIAGLSYWKIKPFRDAIDAVLPDINATALRAVLSHSKVHGSSSRVSKVRLRYRYYRKMKTLRKPGHEEQLLVSTSTVSKGDKDVT